MSTATHFRLALGHLVASLVLAIPITVAVTSAQRVAAAATSTVTNCNDTGPGSLRQAVASAVTGNAVTFALAPACSVITLMSGPIDLTQSVTIDGPGAGNLFVSGANAGTVFVISTGVTGAFDGLTIEHGNADGIDNMQGGAVSVTDTTVTDNRGNGISSCGCQQGSGNVTVIDSTITGNTGGGVSTNLGGEATITDSTVSNNRAGIGIGKYGTLTMVDSTVSDNSPGGGVGTGYPSEATITDSTISGNTSTGDGGGISNDLYADLTVIDSTISGNTSGQNGGGIWDNDAGGPVSLTDTTVSGNSAGGDGGGIYGNVQMASSTVVDNSASANGGGIYSPFSARLVASIVADSGSGHDCYGTVVGRWNLDDDSSCHFTASEHDQSGVDPDLGPLQGNGGRTETMALSPASPAVDVVPAAYCPATDQRGAPRTAPCDIGAYDTDGSPTITGVSPAQGKVGTKVTITGRHLSYATEVSFNGTPATIGVDTSTKITTKVPTGATSGPIRVTTTVGGTVTSPRRFKVRLERRTLRTASGRRLRSSR